MLAHNAKATQYTDNLPVYNIYSKGKAFALASANRDLWEQIFQNVEIKNLDLKVKWFPSHLDDDTKLRKTSPPEWVTKWHIRGNCLADGLAEEAAQLYQLSSDVVSPILENIELVQRIQRRLAAIICSKTNRKKEKKTRTERIRQLPLKSQIENSLHTLFEVDNRLVCTTCQQSVTITSIKAAVWWAHTACRRRDAKLRIGVCMHIGKQTTHHSHMLALHRKVLYCISCGAYSSNRHLILLARPCRPGTAHGLACLESFRRDKLPPGLPSWPEDPGSRNSRGPGNHGEGSLSPMFASNIRLYNIRQRILARSRL